MTGELLGIDLGTSSAKVGLFSRDGQLLSFARRAYPLARSVRDGRAEQDAEQWWTAVRDASRAVLQGHDPRQVKAICAGGQGPTLVLVDERGSAVRPAITWLDTRSGPQGERLARRLGTRLDYSLLPRLLWVAENEPAVYSTARWALQAWDFLAFRLAGARTVAASTLAGDAVWPPAWLEAAGLETSPLIPPPVETGVAYAETAGMWAEEAGLPRGIPIVAGVNDGLGSIVGAAGGVVGRAIDPGGAAGGLALCWDRPLAAPGVACWPGLAPDTYIVGGALAAGGRALDWWAAAAGRGDIPATLELAAQAEAGSGGLVFLPFLAGERAPTWDPEARGAFLGLTLDHHAPHLARAVLEGAACALRLLAESVTGAGGRIDELRLCGRQAESGLWNQIKADITGCRAVVPRVTEVALMGDAVSAAMGTGFYPDLVSAGEAMIGVAQAFVPHPANRPVYDELFALYRAAYPALRPLWRDELRGAFSRHETPPVDAETRPG